MTTTAVTEPQNWSLTQKIAFRFCFIFFVLYVFLEPNGVVPLSDSLSPYYLAPFQIFIPWLAKHVLHMQNAVVIEQSGSGDTMYDYLIMLLITICAIINTALWSVVDRNTKNYNKLYYWLCVIVRYYVALTMVIYGSIKIVKLQFPDPSLGRLMEPVGDMSPMGLAWTYMGHSIGYNYFTGLGEFTCGILLFFRRTTTVGAILGVVVAGNVMAVNYCFDVTVKLLSTMLVVMCIFLLFKDYHRLINFFFKNKDAPPSNLSPRRFNTKWKNVTLLVLKCLIIFHVLYFNTWPAFRYGSSDDFPEPKFYGIYNVQTFIRGHDTLPPLTTDTIRWRKLMIDENAGVQLMSDSITSYLLSLDTIKHHFIISRHKYVLNYTILKPDTILLQGEWKKDTVQMKLVKMNMNSFPLLNHDFHWVNEFGNNR